MSELPHGRDGKENEQNKGKGQADSIFINTALDHNNSCLKVLGWDQADGGNTYRFEAWDMLKRNIFIYG